MKEIVLQPTFYNKFECIGSNCKSNCCSFRWNIEFTKEEFKNIKRRIKSEEFRKLFEDAFIVPKGKEQYYKIKFDERGSCKFLNENGLCKVYQEVGAENMSLVCKSFPRQSVHYIDKYECFLSVGCEEVIRLLTEEKEGVMLEVIERELTATEKESRVPISADLVQTRPAFYYWVDLKILLLGVLQNREYRFGERMVVLGIAMRKIDEIMKNRKFGEIPDYVNQFVSNFNNTKNKEMYTNLFEKADKSGKKRAFETLVYYNAPEEIANKIKEKIELKKKSEIKFGVKGNPLQGNQVLDIEYNVEKYQKAIEDFEEFLKEKEYWLENVMIEGFLSIRMPFHVVGGIWCNYCAMAIIYSTMLFALTCCLQKDSTKEDFMHYVSIIGRNLFHDKVYLESLEKVLKETETNTLAHMAVLVL